MGNSIEDIQRLKAELRDCQKMLLALGNEMRLYLSDILLAEDCKYGSRVWDIAQKTNLSRAAVSRHIQVLKAADLIQSRKEGTHIYYYLDPEEEGFQKLVTMLTDAAQIAHNAPLREFED